MDKKLVSSCANRWVAKIDFLFKNQPEEETTPRIYFFAKGAFPGGRVVGGSNPLVPTIYFFESTIWQKSY